jgi:two-component system, chemotaxis family, sensor kinase CheA
MFIDDEELRDLYKTSAEEHIQAIELALMQLEKQPQNSEPLQDLLRSAHTLKGDSRMLGVSDVETLVHQIEECLMPIEKGRAVMTQELCDRLYTGLDTIQQLAHTAVTGEPNDVNMFYVLANLMGDGVPMPIATTKFNPPTQSVNAQLTELETEDITNSWISLPDEEALFDTPAELWVHEGNTSPISSTASQPPLVTKLIDLNLDLEASLPPPKSPLQASFQDLAAELFATDSTLPVLDRDAVFGDFTIVPGTAPVEDLISKVNSIDDFAFDLTDNFALIPSEVEVGMLTGAGIATNEADLFANFDSLTIDNFATTTGSGSTETLAINPIVDPIVEPTLASLLAPVVDPHPATTPVAPTAATPTETIRIDAKQLDALMGQSGEINVINQQMISRLLDLEALVELWEVGSREDRQIQNLLQQIPVHSPLHRQLNRNHQQWEQMGSLINKFKKAIDADSSRLDLITSALESGVKKLRLLPMTTIFNLFPRMVRDLAKTQSKEINFAIEGGDLLLDKRLLEEIKDPLMHLLRNAIDHGIELPAERQLNGKLAAATLLIQVRQTGSQTTIEILDDGRGLDLQRIRATAIDRGLHTRAELDAMSVDQVQSLIFAAGFSTRKRVTELSGRGVGLDIVRTNVERIKGSVDVESQPHQGCTFRIVLNQAIGSSQVMMVGVRDRTFAIPVEFVDRMLLVNKTEIFALGGKPTTQINGQTITVAWLADLLAFSAIAPNSPGEIVRTSSSISCLLLQSGRQQLALLVDRIDDRQLVTIESPHPLLKQIPNLSGSTILGTGEICLVLNPIDLFATAAGDRSRSAQVAEGKTTSIDQDRVPSILLVEDSLVIRTQMTRILQGAGYQVTTANDGLEGWEKLQAGQFDLIVSDVEMPRWGGLQLTTEIRNHPDYQDLPVVLVTTLSQAADRDRGLQAGANAYLTKGDFDQQLLIDTLNRLI